jgi:Mn2+/Fe2+ NRAMP family transporter
MAFSNVVMFAVILAAASVLGGKHVTINSAADAAAALRPVGGHWASLLFALGFIGSGLLAIPVLAGSGAAGLAGLMHRDFGFSESTKQAPVYYALVGVGIVGGMVLTLLHVNPIKLLIFVAVVNGLAAAPFLVLVMLIARRTDITGQSRNGRWPNVLGWTTVAVMGVAAVALIATGGGL